MKDSLLDVRVCVRACVHSSLLYESYVFYRPTFTCVENIYFMQLSKGSDGLFETDYQTNMIYHVDELAELL
ncbi:hypothetical protein LSAT2_015625 [Lamellibrachia satsuma]|nr:hypothetical protein LSAT2_015625 [Lamellibrachia satsuma]